VTIARTVATLAGVAIAAGRLVAVDLPNATVEHGGFAFADSGGTRLMMLSAPARPQGLYPEEQQLLAAAPAMKTAFCTGGATYPVEFSGHQAADGKSNGRQYAWQFEHLDGFVFGVKGAQPLQENEVCFVAAGAFAASIARVGLVQPDEPAPCDGGVAQRIASVRKHGVTHCWTRARPQGPNGAPVWIVEFARQGSGALASLVVEESGRLVFLDLPGDYSREGGGSVWRVDDGGEFLPRFFKVVLLARRQGSLVLATSWLGAEGTVLGLYESNGDRLRQIILDSWYQAPI